MIHKRTRTKGRSGRHGALLVETTVALILLMIAMSVTVELVGAAGRARIAAERRTRASIEAASLMERLTALPYDKLTAELARGIYLAKAVEQALPDARLTVEIKESPAAPGPPMKHIAILLRYKTATGDWDQPVTLHSWVSRIGGKP
jgi:hypothetical protein